MGRQKQESQCRVIELDKYQKRKTQQREIEKQKLISLVVTEELYAAFNCIDNKDFDYAIGLLTEFIRDIGESYHERPGRSMDTLKANPDLYKSRTVITAELKAKAIEVFGWGNG